MRSRSAFHLRQNRFLNHVAPRCLVPVERFCVPSSPFFSYLNPNLFRFPFPCFSYYYSLFRRSCFSTSIAWIKTSHFSRLNFPGCRQSLQFVFNSAVFDSRQCWKRVKKGGKSERGYCSLIRSFTSLFSGFLLFLPTTNRCRIHLTTGCGTLTSVHPRNGYDSEHSSVFYGVYVRVST